jgi:hypothetical protein
MSAKYLILILLNILSMGMYGQVFQNNTTVTIPASSTTYSFLTNSIAVTGLPTSLDGVSLGLTQVDVAFNSVQFPRIDIFVVTPGNRMIQLFSALSGAGATTVAGNLTFTMAAGNPDIRYWTPTNPPPATPFLPEVSFNTINDGSNPNGTWRILARINNVLSAGTNQMTDFKLTFGTNNIAPMKTNDDCSGATPLINTKLAGAFVSGTSFGYGSSLPNTDRGSYVCSGSPYAENSAWFTFVASCTDDSIAITTNGGSQTGIVRGTCGTNMTVVSTFCQNTTYHTFMGLGLTPGTRYYLVMDGNNGLGATFDIRWYPGACAPTPVTLLYLNAKYDPASSLINVDWKTAYEKNNLGFHVEVRLVSGGDQFTEAGFVPAISGESSESYSFNFRPLAAGLYEFRLIQEDLDGTKTTSHSAFATAGDEGDPLKIYYTYPYQNPAASYYLANPEKINYEVVNVNGIQVFSSSMMGTAGYNHLDLSETLPPGIYFLQAQTRTSSSVKKLALLK